MPTIEISEDTLSMIKKQLGEDCFKSLESLQDLVGKAFFFRTVTYHLTGRVKSVCGSILELEDAAWIADSGRFMNAIKEGKLNEVEPVGIAYVNFTTICDAFPWVHTLPKNQK